MKSLSMNQHRHIWLLAVLSLFAATSYSQQDSRADKYLQAVSQQFDLNKGYVIQMDYIREDLMQETSAEGEGVIWMKGLKYKIMVDEYIVYFNEEKLYSQNTETEEVYVSEPDPDQPGYLQAVPIKIIKAYEQDFNYMYIGNASMMGKTLIEIQLYPKDRSGAYSMLKMFVNPHSQKLEVTQLKHKEGILYTMIFSEIKVDDTLKESMFDFDPSVFPNTEIIELIE
jgi:outer membrane lipoprotein-sorting protein